MQWPMLLGSTGPTVIWLTGSTCQNCPDPLRAAPYPRIVSGAGLYGVLLVKGHCWNSLDCKRRGGFRAATVAASVGVQFFGSTEATVCSSRPGGQRGVARSRGQDWPQATAAGGA